MLNILINELDSDLQNCENFMAIGNFIYAKASFDQAFGKLLMFSIMQPDMEETSKRIWNNSYRPKFEHIIYGS